MKAYGGADVHIHVFFIWAAARGDWSVSRPGRFTPGVKSPLCPLNMILGGRQTRSGRCGEKSRHYWDSNSDPLAFQPVSSSSAECDILTPEFTSLRLTFTFHLLGSVMVKALCYKPGGRGFETR
jgi:hypothetical protein